MALDLKRDSAHQVVAGAGIGYYVDSGHLVYVLRGDQTVLAVPFDLKTLQPKGAPVAVLDSVGAGGRLGAYLTVSLGGTVVMRSETIGQLREFTMVWVDRNGPRDPGGLRVDLSPHPVRRQLWLAALPRRYPPGHRPQHTGRR